jgi:MFS family permease
MLIFITKVIEGIAGSFIGPCLAALTLANFGPSSFDKIMASNILWGHIGSVVAAILAGTTSYVLYPNVKYCFLVIGAAALLASVFIQYVPEGDPLMGRGFKGKVALNEFGRIENIQSDYDEDIDENSDASEIMPIPETRSQKLANAPQAWSYREVLAEPKTLILCCTGFFFQ